MAHHILIVDDEDDVRLVLEDLFTSRGYNVSQAPDGAAALEKLKATEEGEFPDLLLADYQMPNMNGIEFLAASLKICPSAMRILLTAHGDLQVAVDAINQAQVYKFITKPWNNNDLLLTVQRAMEHYDLIRENRAFADMLEMMVEESTEEMERMRNALQDMAKKIRGLIP
jgi:DNA-binding NtrC family response regulator